MTDPQHEETFADTERKLREIITTLRAQLAEARAELHGPVEHLSAQEHSNIIAHLSPELEHIGALPNRNSLMMALVEATNAARKDAARADRAEAALAAQIEADMETCGQCMGSGYGGHPDSGVSCPVCGGSGGVRNQPHDRTALDRHDATTREKALREAADELRGQGYGAAVRTILALIEKPNAC